MYSHSSHESVTRYVVLQDSMHPREQKMRKTALELGLFSSRNDRILPPGDSTKLRDDYFFLSWRATEVCKATTICAWCEGETTRASTFRSAVFPSLHPVASVLPNAGPLPRLTLQNLAASHLSMCLTWGAPTNNPQGSWNYRIKFDVDLPLKSPEHGRLALQVFWVCRGRSSAAICFA